MVKIGKGLIRLSLSEASDAFASTFWHAKEGLSVATAVSLINWKGGVGKTTLTLHLAAGLANRHSKRVLLVDLDPQCNLSFLALVVHHDERDG